MKIEIHNRDEHPGYIGQSLYEDMDFIIYKRFLFKESTGDLEKIIGIILQEPDKNYNKLDDLPKYIKNKLVREII